jgi:hypothetical protein
LGPESYPSLSASSLAFCLLPNARILEHTLVITSAKVEDGRSPPSGESLGDIWSSRINQRFIPSRRAAGTFPYFDGDQSWIIPAIDEINMSLVCKQEE